VDEKTATFVAHYLSTIDEESRRESMHGRAYLNNMMSPAIKDEHKGKEIFIDANGKINVDGEEAIADWTGLPQYVLGTHWKRCTVPKEKMDKLVSCGVAKLRDEEGNMFKGEEEYVNVAPGTFNMVAVNEYIKTPKKDIYYAPHQSMPMNLGTHNKWEQTTNVPYGGHVLHKIDFDEMFLSTNCYIPIDGKYKYLQPLKQFWGIRGRVRAIKSTIEYFGAPVVIEDKRKNELARFYNPYDGDDRIPLEDILSNLLGSSSASSSSSSASSSLPTLAPSSSPLESTSSSPGWMGGRGRGGKGGGRRGKGEGKGGGGGDGKGGEWAWDEWLRKQREQDAVQQIVNFLKNKEVVSVEEIAQALGVGRSR
jgi:hypothetical protein